MADERPARASMTNTDTGETLVFQFNPEVVTATLEPAYKELEVMGASATVDQYSHTKTFQVEFELTFDCLVDREWDAAKLEDAQRFIYSLAYSSAGDQVGQTAPPAVLFVWPKLYSLVGKLRKPTFVYKRFARSGMPTLATSKVDFREILSIRRSSEQVRAQGMR